jgi:hypothetical protein
MVILLDWFTQNVTIRHPPNGRLVRGEEPFDRGVGSMSALCLVG